MSRNSSTKRPMRGIPRGAKDNAMCDKKSTDKLAIGIAIVSLVVSIAAVAFPYMEQRRQFRVLQNEGLAVSLNPHSDGLFRFTTINLGQSGHVVQVPWGLTLSNTGNQKVSITEYSITAGVPPSSTVYSGIDGGMFNPDLKPVALPLTLDTGESRRFILFVGMLVPPKVYDVLSPVGAQKSLTIGDATKVLGRQGLDIYGNKVDYQEFAGGIYLLSVERGNQKCQTFCYRAVSGRGNVFLNSAAAYERP